MEDSFLDSFAPLTDVRSKRNRLHTVSEILLCTFSAVICGAEGWRGVENFGKSKIDYLRQFLSYKNGIPSDDTFRRFFRNVDPDEFQRLFRDWIQTLNINNGNVIAIDGKSSRRSFDGDDKMLHMISAYATEAKLVVAQAKVHAKSNEITAIPKLLQWLDIQGKIITIDAMGCQFSIANQIVDKGGEYVFSLKGNQGNLLDDIKFFLTDNMHASSFEKHEDCTKGHGRIEKRTCWTSSDVSWLHQRHPNWKSVNTITRIDSVREIKGKVTTETRFYITSMNVSAQKILTIIKSHWAIENSLHWILDMSFNDDQSRIRKQNAPHAMAILKHIALNLLQLTKQQMPRQSIKGLRQIAGWNHEMLTIILSQKFS